MDDRSGERRRTDESGPQKAPDLQSDWQMARLVQARLFGPPGGLTGRLIAGAIRKRKETLQ